MADCRPAAPTDPGAPDFDPAFYLEERYAGAERKSALLKAYYAAKPVLPRRLQLALRRAYAPRQAARSFPAWPIEPILVEHRDATLRRELERTGEERLPFVGYWPDGGRFAVTLTHDVEGPAGVENIPRVLEVERRHGFVSSWNFVAEWYPIPDGTFDALRAAGCEVGLHGIRHDGKLFQDREHFERDLPKIHCYLKEWGAVGFRSPATHRNPDWMPELGCLYDSSFPDTDPFEPQSGGCCSVFPFFLRELVELPITLPQDHTLWEILRDRSIERWVQKSRWIMRQHGLINVIVHPDYVIDAAALDRYERFLCFLGQQNGAWRALPWEVAAWWKDRAGLRCELAADGSPTVTGEAAARASVAWARRRDGHVAIEL